MSQRRSLTMSSFQVHYNTVSFHYSFGKTLETFLPSKIYSREIDSSLGVRVAPSTLGGMCQTLVKTSILFYLIYFLPYSTLHKGSINMGSQFVPLSQHLMQDTWSLRSPFLAGNPNHPWVWGRERYTYGKEETSLWKLNSWKDTNSWLWPYLCAPTTHTLYANKTGMGAI